MKSNEHFWSYLRYNVWKACCGQHKWGKSEEFSESIDLGDSEDWFVLEQHVVFHFVLNLQGQTVLQLIKCKELVKTIIGLVNSAQLICI